MHASVRLVAISSFLVFAACVCYCMYTGGVHRPVRDDLVNQWIDIAFERRRLAGLNAAAVIITTEDYEMKLAELSEKEQGIVFHTEFPNYRLELSEFLLSRATGNHHPNEFWLLFFASGVSLAAATAWLLGHSAGVADTKLAPGTDDAEA